MQSSSRENYRNIFDASPDPIAISRVADGKLVLINRAFERVSEYQRDEALGRTSVELGLWPVAEERERCFKLLQATGELRNLDMTFRSRTGKVLPFLVSAAKVWFNGEPCSMTVTRDVTELRKAQAELEAARKTAEAASRAKSDFLSGMSHEIRTPMNAILGMAELLAETSLDDQQRRYLQLMRSNGSALLALINDILDLARIERGLLNLEVAELDIQQVVRTTVELLSIRASEKGLQLLSRIDEHLPRYRIGDPLRLRQILINLVGNAIKFTSTGTIRIEVRLSNDADDSVVFAVTDTGIGIPADKIGAIFSSFTQADSSTARRYGGSGLGLAIATQLVALMGGRIWVESQEGLGSQFYFTASLPQQSSAHENSAGPSAPGELAPSHLRKVPEALRKSACDSQAIRPLDILIVDDSIDNRFLLKSFLKHLPFSLVEADNGLRAVELATSRHFDLVLMDMQMPIMDGYTATRRIREWECAQTKPAVPIIALTASALNGDITECLTAGCDFHVSKPINRATLVDTIMRAAQQETPVNAAPLAASTEHDSR